MKLLIIAGFSIVASLLAAAFVVNSVIDNVHMKEHAPGPWIK